MLDELSPESHTDQGHDGPLSTMQQAPRTAFEHQIMVAGQRMERVRVPMEQLSHALRIADAPESIDRATIPLALPMGLARLKELGALVRLSSFLRADILAVLSVFRSEREELRRIEHAARVAQDFPELALTGEAEGRVRRLFTWLRVARERFRDHRAIYDLLDLDEALGLTQRTLPAGVPQELADLFRPASETLPLPIAPINMLTQTPPGQGGSISTSWRALLTAFKPIGEPEPSSNPQLQPTEDPQDPVAVLSLLAVPSVELELGLGLVPLVDPALGGDLLDRIVPMRVGIALELGFVTPGIQVRDNFELPDNGYRVIARGIVVARGELMPGLIAAIQDSQTETEPPLPGFAALEPMRGREMLWIPPHVEPEARNRGFVVSDAAGVLIAHLDRALRASACDVLALEEVKVLVDKVAERAPVVAAHLFPERMDIAELHQILRALLRERVSIRDLVTIMERIAHLLVWPRVDPNANRGGISVGVQLDPADPHFVRSLERLDRAMPRIQAPLDTQSLVEALRQALAREICAAIADSQDQLDIVTLAPELEAQLLEAVVSGREARALSLPAAKADSVLAIFARTCRHLDVPIVVCDARLRAALKRFTARAIPHLHVLSHAELHPQFRARTIATIGFERDPLDRAL